MTPRVTIYDNKSYDSTGLMIIKCRGECSYQGFIMQFSLNKGGASGYRVRGHINAPDPNTGFILKRKGSSGKVPCQVDIHINDKNGKITEKIIKKKVAEAAKTFYLKFHDEIKDAMRTPLSTMTNTLLYYLYSFKDAWLNNTRLIRSSNERPRLAAFSLLEKLFSTLDSYYVNEISGELIEKALKPFGTDARRTAMLGADFWDFCADKNAISKSIPNPFKDITIPAKNKKNNNTKHTEVTALTTAQESALQSIIRDNYLSNPLDVAIALIIGAYYYATTVLSLTWKDIIFSPTDEHFVCIRLKKGCSSGGTLTYTRPVSLFAAEVLHGYYQHLIDSGLSKSQLARLPVVYKKGTKYTSKDITQRCQAIMKSIYIPYSTLNDTRLAQPSTSASISILRATYRNTLSTICGLKKQDPAALSYLCSLSLNDDTTADRYRSFSSPEGLRLLYKYFCRDTRFRSPRTEPTIIDTVDQNGVRLVTVYPEKPTSTAGCTIDVILNPGDTLTVRSDSRLTGTYSASKI